MKVAYDALCEACDIGSEYMASYDNRDKDTPDCPECGEKMERAWLGNAPYSTPERMWKESKLFKGVRAKVNDCDDPWEGTGTTLCAEQSEEFVAKSKERRGIPRERKRLIFV